MRSKTAGMVVALYRMTRIPSQGLHRLVHGRAHCLDAFVAQALQPFPATEALEHGPPLCRVADLGEDDGPQFRQQSDPVAERLVELILQESADLVGKGRGG